MLLAALVAGLLCICVLSVWQPISFQQQRSERERVVKQRLLAIGQAQTRFLARHGHYAASLDSLDVPDSVKEIPYSSGGFQFVLRTGMKKNRDGRDVPVMECGAVYEDYLEGLNAREIEYLNEEAAAEGRYPGLRIGDINIPNNHAGNWE
jgi:hypothetical protein